MCVTRLCWCDKEYAETKQCFALSFRGWGGGQWRLPRVYGTLGRLAYVDGFSCSEARGGRGSELQQSHREGRRRSANGPPRPSPGCRAAGAGGAKIDRGAGRAG